MNDKKDNIQNDKVNMNILKKIMATIRTESRELTDAVLGSYGTGKVEQKFESAQYKLNEAKVALTEMMRRGRQTSRIVDITVDKINLQEKLIDKALANGNEAEAMKYAHEVVDLEITKDIQIETNSSISLNIDYLQRQLEKSERELKELARQLTMLKTNENVQKATEAIMGSIDEADANLLSANKSLHRIREKQKGKNDLLSKEESMDKLISQPLPEQKIDKLALKDSINRAQDVIKRIQDKR
jgi:phage shock protein A